MNYYDHFFDFPTGTDVSGMFPHTDDKPRYVIGPEPHNGRIYVCVRAPEKLATPKGATVTDPAIAVPIVGTFLDLDEDTKQLRVSYIDATGKKQVRDEATKRWAVKATSLEAIEK